MEPDDLLRKRAGAASGDRADVPSPVSWPVAVLRAVDRSGVPVRRWEFWLVLALIVMIAAGHAVFEVTDALEGAGHFYVISVALFIVPVLYAALSFGVRGSLPAALWCVVVMVPNLATAPRMDLVGELWELGIVVAMGVFAGQRVDRETRARSEAERRELARLASEQRYRGLFDRAPVAILLIDGAGVVEEANAAAAELLGEPIGDLCGKRIDELLGDEIAAILLGSEQGRVVALPVARSHTVWVEPMGAPYPVPGGAPRIQAILRDVTELRERQEGIEAYARITVAAREEERRRIAREIHDGPVQSLVLLWRMLNGLQRHPGSEGRASLANASGLALRVADELRKTSQNLRPAILDDLGLVPALRSECRAVAERGGIRVRFRMLGDVRQLSQQSELMILRVAQEALRNVESHARASQAAVTLSFRPTEVRLSISDDGRGLDRVPSHADLLASGRLGIVGMTERARLLGASCQVRTRRRGGTNVEVTVPSAPVPG